VVGGCLFGVEACDGRAAVDSIEGFGEDCGEKANGDGEGLVDPVSVEMDLQD
jgi:hypothetical protein